MDLFSRMTKVKTGTGQGWGESKPGGKRRESQEIVDAASWEIFKG